MTKIPQTVKAAHLIDVTSSDALALANTARPARDIPGRSNSGPHHHDSDFMPGVPHLSPRNAPIPNRQPNTLRSMTRSGTVTPDANPAYTDIETGLGLHSPSKDGGSAPSREVSFARKLQATLSTGLGVGVPLAAANVGTERIAGALLDMAHSRHLPPTSLRASFAAGSLGIAADIVVTGMVTAAGHVYLDKKFYHDQNKTADEMIAAKKANSVILSYLGGAGTSLATSLAATAMTGTAITAGTVKTALITQAIGGAILHPVIFGAAAGALAYHRRNPPAAPRAPDGLQAGLENHAHWIQEKLAAPASVQITTPDPQQLPAILPGDDMV